jgi:hypothetical protein
MKKFYLSAENLFTSSTFLSHFGLALGVYGSGFLPQMDSAVAWAVPTVVVLILVSFGSYIFRRMQAKRMSGSLYYDECRFIWYFGDDGDFNGRYIYTLTNASKRDLEVLPRNSILKWKKTEIPKVFTRIIGNSPHQIASMRYSGHTVRDKISEFFVSKISEIEFDTQIVPPLGPGDSISYENYISTLGSDAEAFDSNGSILGIPSTLPIHNARIECHAPLGFRFELLSDPFFVDLKGESKLPEQEWPDSVTQDIQIDQSGSVMVWSIKDLPARYRLWTRYRFVTAD